MGEGFETTDRGRCVCVCGCVEIPFFFLFISSSVLFNEYFDAEYLCQHCPKIKKLFLTCGR